MFGLGNLGPVIGEDVVGLAPEQETVGVRDSIGDEPPRDLVAIGGLPASMREATLWVLVGAAGSLHDAVQGQKCVHNDFGHTLLLHQDDDEPHRPESTGWGMESTPPDSDFAEFTAEARSTGTRSRTRLHHSRCGRQSALRHSATSRASKRRARRA